MNEKNLAEFADGNFDSLEHFYDSREKILETIRFIDTQLDQADSALVPSDEQKSLMKESMSIKEEYVNRILNQDLQILSFIEQAKSNIIRELQEIRRVKKAVGSYKSGPQAPRFNEEA